MNTTDNAKESYVALVCYQRDGKTVSDIVYADTSIVGIVLKDVSSIGVTKSFSQSALNKIIVDQIGCKEYKIVNMSTRKVDRQKGTTLDIQRMDTVILKDGRKGKVLDRSFTVQGIFYAIAMLDDYENKFLVRVMEDEIEMVVPKQ